MALRRSCLIFAAGLFATLSLARPVAAAEPRWVPVGPPAALPPARLVVEPGNGNRVYAFNQRGLWLSRDDAESWRSLQTGLGLPPLAVASDPFQPGRIYAVAMQPFYTGGIYRSDDFGAHWTPVFQPGPTYDFFPQALVADPLTKDSLFWISDEYLSRSRDGGRTWSCVGVGSSCDNFRVQAFAVAPDRPKTLYVIDSYGFFRVSRDDGRTWTWSDQYLGDLDVLVATREPRVLYAGMRSKWFRGLNPCLKRSDDDGETWKDVLPSWTADKCGAPAIDSGDPRTVRMVVAADSGPQLWVSRNGGDTWSSAGPVPERGDVYVLPGGGLALVTDKGFFRAPAEQGPWQAVGRGFAAADVSSVLVVEGAVLAAPAVSLDYSPDPSQVSLLRTEDGGRSWESEALANPLALAADPSDPLHLIASAARLDETGRHFRILESRDGGHAWRGVVDPEVPRPYNATALAIDPFLPRTFYSNGGLSGGVYRSDDGGLTWRDSNLGLRRSCYRGSGCFWRQVHTILTDPTQAGRMFIRLNDNTLHRSLDYGISWTQLGTHRGPSGGAVFALARDLEGALIVIGGGPRPDDGYSLGVAYRSTDHGATWTRLGRLPRRSDISSWVGLTGLAATEGALWVSSQAEGVFRSTDGGRTWRSANQGLPLPSITSLVTDPEDPERLYATVLGNGIYTLAAP